VPASIDLQLDGSRVKRKDCLATPNRTAVRQAEDAGPAMVTYRFDALPRALRVAIPCTYGGALFEEGPTKERAQATEQQRLDQKAVRVEPRGSGDAQNQSAKQIDALRENGRKVTVVAVGPDPERKGTFIVAGQVSGKKTDDSKPVAVRIDPNTTLFKPTGEPLPAASAAELPERSVMMVKGKQSKRGLIRAKRVVVMT
jgi:hypothetical protein